MKGSESDRRDITMEAGNEATRVDSTRYYIVTIFVITLALTIPATIIGLSVGNLVSVEVNTALISTSDTIATIVLVMAVVFLCILIKEQMVSAVPADIRYARRMCDLLLDIYPCGYIGFLGMVGILGLASLVLPGFKIVAIGNCFLSLVTFQTTLEFFMNICKIVFIVCQLLYLTRFNKPRRKSPWTLVCTLVIFSTNICLCVDCILKAANQTVLNIQQGGHGYNHTFCDSQTKSMSNAYRVIDTYLYSFIFHFCAYSIEILFVAWAAIVGSDDSIQEPQNDRDNANEHQTLLHLPGANTPRSTWTKLKTIFCVNLCRVSYIPTVMVCIALFILHITHESKSSASSWIISVYMNTISGAAFVGFILIRKETFSRTNLLPKHIVLIFSGYIFLIFTVVENVYAIYNMAVSVISVSDILLFFFWNLFHVIGLVFQTLFLIRLSDIPYLDSNTNRYAYVLGILWFLSICNLEMFAENTFLQERVMKHVSNKAGEKLLISDIYRVCKRVLFPGTSLYRLQSCLLSLENIRKLKTSTRQTDADY